MNEGRRQGKQEKREGMGRPGVHQVPEGSGEHGKMEETGCKIICGAPTTFAVKGQIVMMMIVYILLTCDTMQYTNTKY